MKELKFFITDKANVGGYLHYFMNQKSNAVMNMKTGFPLNIISRCKAIILEFVLTFLLPNKHWRSSHFVSLFHLLFGKMLDSEHYMLKKIFDVFMRRLEKKSIR